MAACLIPADDSLMVIVLLQGGLGTQMFQYAAALGSLRPDEPLYADLHGLYDGRPASAPFTPGRYGLGIFPCLRIRKVAKLVHRIFNSPRPFWWLLRRIVGRNVSRIAQQHGGLLPEPQQRRRSLYLNGVFKQERYFVSKRAQLLADFSFPEPDDETAMLAAAMQSRKNAVAVYIRAGENGGPDLSGGENVPGAGYYLECLRIIRGQAEQPHFYVFADDPGWCRSTLGLDGPDVTFVGVSGAGAAWKDMFLMTRCAHHILTGSDFSWWGAWLSQRRGQRFIPAAASGDLLADGWTAIGGDR